MGEWLIWLILGSLMLIVFCIYSLSSQVERCVHLAVEIITGNQRKIMAHLEALAEAQPPASLPPNVVPFERRLAQRRRHQPVGVNGFDDRRRIPGRRRADLLAQSSEN